MSKTAIPRSSISRLIREICRSHNVKIRVESVDILHKNAEYFMAELFSASKVVCAHSGRQTLRSKDLQVAIEVSTIFQLDESKLALKDVFSKS